MKCLGAMVLWRMTVCIEDCGGAADQNVYSFSVTNGFWLYSDFYFLFVRQILPVRGGCPAHGQPGELGSNALSPRS